MGKKIANSLPWINTGRLGSSLQESDYSIMVGKLAQAI